MQRAGQGALCYLSRPHKRFCLSEQDRVMVCPVTSWLSPQFYADGDPAARDQAQPDQTQW